MPLSFLLHELLANFSHLFVKSLLDALDVAFEGHSREHEFADFHRVLFFLLLFCQSCKSGLLLGYPLGFCFLLCDYTLLFLYLLLNGSLFLLKSCLFFFDFQECVVVGSSRFVLICIVLCNFTDYVQVLLITDNARG